eukprot:9201975-Pyramimonas_sp.AAC.1
MTDEELDALLPSDGYQVLEPPASYVPIRTPARKLLATPTPGMTPLYQLPEEDRGQKFDVPTGTAIEGLPEMKPEDYQVKALRLGSVLTRLVITILLGFTGPAQITARVHSTPHRPFPFCHPVQCCR